MRLPKLGERGQTGAISMQLGLIISLLMAVIIIHQLWIADIGPTDNENDPDYDKDALDAYQRVQTLAWAGIGLMAIAIIILAASVIISVVRGFSGAERAV